MRTHSLIVYNNNYNLLTHYVLHFTTVTKNMLTPILSMGFLFILNYINDEYLSKRTTYEEIQSLLSNKYHNIYVQFVLFLVTLNNISYPTIQPTKLNYRITA